MIPTATVATCRTCGLILPTLAQVRRAGDHAAAVDRAAEQHVKATGHCTVTRTEPKEKP